MLAAFMSVSGCEEEETARPVAEGEPATRAAQSFVHCVEAGGGDCVETVPKLGAWDAFSMLGWLASGSPLALLQALPRELAHHQDARSVQRRFVDQIDRQREALRGSECRSERVDKLDAMVPKLVSASQSRLTAMGLWSGDLENVVSGLASEAAGGLKGGYLVSMRCQGAPYELYLATVTEEQRQVVVGVLTVLPEFLGGTAPSRDSTSGKLRSISLGTGGKMAVVSEGIVDTWIGIPVEDF